MTQSRESQQGVTSAEAYLPDAGAVNLGLREQAISQQSPYAPLSSQSVFWRPRHVARSAMLSHVPYLFWLMETVRPKTVAQIGLGDGLVYMTLCQAAERIGVQTSLVGVAVAGDAQGEPRLPEPFHARHALEYADFSTLTRDSLASIGQRYGDELDMLVLNAPPDHGLVHGIGEHVVPVLSDKGVILICQPRADQQAFQMMYTRLGLASRRSVCGLLSPGRGGLDVVLYGSRQPERLLALGDGIVENPVRMVARQVFGRLGEGLVNTLELEELQRTHEKSVEAHRLAHDEATTLMRAREDVARLLALSEEKNDALSQRLEKVTAEHSVDLSRIEALRAEQADLTAKHTALLQERSERLTEVEALRAVAAKRDPDMEQKLEEHVQLLQSARAEKAELERKYEQRLDDIAILANEFSAKDAAQAARIQELEGQLAETRSALSAASEDQLRLHNEVVALLSSTSWRVTWPLRGVRRLLSGDNSQGN